MAPKKKPRPKKTTYTQVTRELRALKEEIRLLEIRIRGSLTQLSAHVAEMNNVPQLLAHIGNLNMKLLDAKKAPKK